MTLPMGRAAGLRRGADRVRLHAARHRPEACSSWFLPRVVGISRAMEVGGDRPHLRRERGAGGRAGAQRPCAGRVARRRHGLAREIAANTAPVSVALARRMMWRMLGAGHPMQAHRVDSRAMFHRGQSADAREGVASFLEKRGAQFPDRVSSGLPDVFPGWEEPAFS
jgi:enoyl-CoA hydratase/carnithine racemase